MDDSFELTAGGGGGEGGTTIAMAVAKQEEGGGEEGCGYRVCTVAAGEDLVASPPTRCCLLFLIGILLPRSDWLHCVVSSSTRSSSGALKF